MMGGRGAGDGPEEPDTGREERPGIYDRACASQKHEVQVVKGHWHVWHLRQPSVESAPKDIKTDGW